MKKLVVIAFAFLAVRSAHAGPPAVSGVVTKHPLILTFRCREENDPAVRLPADPAGEAKNLDFDGDGTPEILILETPAEHQREFVWSIRFRSGAAVRVALRSSTFQSINQAVSGDFNGDGRSDLAVRRAHAERGDSRGWSVLLSRGNGAVPYLTEGLPDESIPGERWIARDRDGDGLADLLRFLPDAPPLLCSGVHGEPVPGALLTISPGGEAVKSADDGSFSLVIDPAVESVVSVEMKDLRFLRESRRYVPGGSLRLNFTGFDHVGSPDPLVPSTGPSICVGFDARGIPGSETEEWGRTSRCAPGYAFVGAANGMQRKRAVSDVDIYGDCCRLPPGVLVEGDAASAEGECPEDTIATAVDDLEGKRVLRCAKIDTARYRLGPKLRGAYWGYDHTRQAESRRIDLRVIPVGLRAGLGRASYLRWDPSGCVAEVPGAVLTGKAPGGCDALTFRELLYRDAAGAHREGEAVRIFPACRELENAFVPYAGCVPE